MLELAPTLLTNVAPRLPRLEVVTGDDHRAVFLNAHLDARPRDLPYHGRGAGPFGPVGHVPAARGDHWAHPMVRVGPETVAAIVCGFALRFRSIEDLKNAQRADLGVLLGTAQAPTVLVLRQKIQTLVESVDPAALARACFQHYLALEPVSEGLYYTDGHFCPYV